MLLASGQWAMAKVIAVEANGYSVECVTEKGPSQMAIPFDDAATQLRAMPSGWAPATGSALEASSGEP